MKAVALAALLIVGACTTQSDDDAASESEIRSSESTSSASAPPTADSTVPQTTDVAIAAATTELEPDGRLFCGDFGAEQLPALIAIDIASGDVVWRQCPEEAAFIPSQIVGRAGAATLLLEQDGRGGESIRGVDESGVEYLRRPTRMGGSPLLVSGATSDTERGGAARHGAAHQHAGGDHRATKRQPAHPATWDAGLHDGAADAADRVRCTDELRSSGGAGRQVVAARRVDRRRAVVDPVQTGDRSV